MKFRQDLVNIARTTLSSKVLSQDKDYFSNLAVDAVLRLKVCCSAFTVYLTFIPFPLQGSTDLDHIQIIKKVGGKLTDSYLDEGETNSLLVEVAVLIHRGIRLRFHTGQIHWGELPEETRKCQHPHCQHMCAFSFVSCFSKTLIRFCSNGHR